jgi:hypothetical protein
MIACWFNKRVIAHSVESGEMLPDSAQHHIDGCSACRQFLERERDLTRQLFAGAEQHRQTPSPFLHARIMASLHRQGDIVRPERKFRYPIWAAALVMVGLGLFSIPMMRHSQTPYVQPNPQASATVIHQLAANGSTSGPILFEWSQALDKPLEAEMQSVISDAKTAIQLLAQNFLPETSLASSPLNK